VSENFRLGWKTLKLISILKIYRHKKFYYPDPSGNTYRRGRRLTVDLLIKIACFAKIKISVLKAAALVQLVQGGQQY
jgi:hypothetical protein